MSEQPMDGFDARLVALLTAFGDRAVTTYDAAAIARAAVAGNRRSRGRLALLWDPRVRVLILGALVALLALAAVLLAASRRSSPIGDSFASPTAGVWSPDGATLAFVVDVADSPGPSAASIGRPSHPELWAVSGDGGIPARLAVLHGTAYTPDLAWTRDGRSILLAQGPSPSGTEHSAILAIGQDGTTTRSLVDGGTDAIGLQGLAPDGDRLLFVRRAASGSGADLYVLDLASGASEPMTTSHRADGTASWSPDGASILYTDSGEILVADGSGRHRLGQATGADPVWSADGRRAFLAPEGGPVYSVAADGTDMHVAWNVDASAGLVPSPDRSRYVAATSDGLRILRPGESPIRLTSGHWDQQPIWSPDGTAIAFRGYIGPAGALNEGVGGLYVVPAAGGEPKPVPRSALPLQNPWRPGAGRIALTLVRDRAIVLADRDGNELRTIVARSTVAGDPLGSSADAGPTTLMVVGRTGPDRDIYHVPVGAAVMVENQSDVAWVPWEITEKDVNCTLVFGLPAGSPCTVAPHSTVRYATPDWYAGQVLTIYLAREGTDWRTGIPAILDVVGQP